LKLFLTVVLIFFTAMISACGISGESNGVIIGKNDFLFNMSADGYDYIADFNGKYAFADDELNQTYNALNKRRLAYANNGIYYLVAVIPNTQTVYPENMPPEYGTPGDNTRLKQLSEFIRQKGGINFIDLTETLISAKEEGQLYNNTDNSLNARGAYYAYTGIFHQLPEKMRTKNKINTDIIDKLTETKTEGLSLAGIAGVDIKNNTVLLNTTDEDIMYSIMGNKELLLSTYVKIGYKSEIPTVPALLIELEYESDLDNFLPYFSSTYGSAGYKINYMYSKSAVNSVAPKAVVQIIREDRLSTLLDEEINASYNAAMKPGDDPTTSMTPILLSTVMTDKKTACIIGTVEAGSLITVSGSTFETFTAYPQHERFFIPITLKKGQKDTVTLTASVEGKSISSALEVPVAYSEGAGHLTVFAGKDSQLHYPDTLADYYCTNLFTDNQLAKMESRLMKKLDKIRGAAGKETKLLFLIPPDAITAYPETATDEMTEKKTSDYSRLMQIEDYFADNSDIIIINLTDTIHENKDKGKLYYQTDTHWNTLGSYFGYYKMMQVIAEEFPAAAPRELSEYNVYQQYEAGGDLVNFLGVSPGTVSEYKIFCVPNFTNRATITNYFTGSSSYTYSDQIKCVVDNKDLPNAIMICDSFGSALLDFITDAFGLFVRQSMWEYKTDLNLIDEIQPDYYIQVMVERNMANLVVG
jgi:succinate dehydrogenase flavin-adding protein (antitoxin of CptAB toxin-antitoxin module)